MFAYVCRLILLFICIEGVFGADPDTVKSVTEGDSVTLNTNVNEVQRYDQILWMFGPQETRIAELYRQEVAMFDSTQKFGDRLKLECKTGSLTIRNIRPEHSGLYKLQIRSNRGNSDKAFNITVHAPLPVPNISRHSTECTPSSQNCLLICSVVNMSHVTLSWLKGNSVLSSISASDLSISLSLPLEVEDQEKNIYSCEINNTFTHQNTQLDISEHCWPCPDTPSLIPSLIYAVVGVAAVTLLFYYVRHKRDNECRKRKTPSQLH